MLLPKAWDTLNDSGCLRRKTGIVKQPWWVMVRHDCFTMTNFCLEQPKIMQCISGLKGKIIVSKWYLLVPFGKVPLQVQLQYLFSKSTGLCYDIWLNYFSSDHCIHILHSLNLVWNDLLIMHLKGTKIPFKICLEQRDMRLIIDNIWNKTYNTLWKVLDY